MISIPVKVFSNPISGIAHSTAIIFVCTLMVFSIKFRCFLNLNLFDLTYNLLTLKPNNIYQLVDINHEQSPTVACPDRILRVLSTTGNDDFAFLQFLLFHNQFRQGVPFVVL